MPKRKRRKRSKSKSGYFGVRKSSSGKYEATISIDGYPKYLGSEGVMKFCERLIKEHGIMLLPGNIYDSANGPSPNNHFRIGYGRKAVKEGLIKFQEALAN